MLEQRQEPRRTRITRAKSKKKQALLVTLLLSSCALVLSSHVSFSPNTVVGVTTGDWVRYDVRFCDNITSWLYGVTYKDCLKSMTVEVVDANGTVVTLRQRCHYESGPDDSYVVTVDIEPSAKSSYFTFLIPADSRVRDTIWMKDQFTRIALEGLYTYAGTERTYLSVPYPPIVSPYDHPEAFYDYDKETGFILEVSVHGISVFVVEATNMWSSAFFGLDWWIWITLIAVIVISSVCIALSLSKKKFPSARKNQQRKTPCNDTPPKKHGLALTRKRKLTNTTSRVPRSAK
jgi:hypothetical protein